MSNKNALDGIIDNVAYEEILIFLGEIDTYCNANDSPRGYVLSS